jgi:hypothetical protein
VILKKRFLEDSFLSSTTTHVYLTRSSSSPGISPKAVADPACFTEFPTTKDISTGGPPWALPPNVYKALLRHPGEELPYDDSGNLLESQLGDPSKTGLQQIAHFQPKRTHEFMGYNTPGNISDWIGVWIHPHSSL